MMPPYERHAAPRRQASSHRAGLVESDMPFRTTYRCVRMGCAMTVRLLDPIDRCPRCSASVAAVEGPQVDLDVFVAEATVEVVAGVEALLRG